MIKYAIIIDENTKKCDVGLGTDSEYYESIGMTEMEVEQDWAGQWYVAGYAPEKPAPTYEEQKQARANAYREEVDPITAHIERLKDAEQTEETIEKIKELQKERDSLVEDIKKRYPYPEVISEEETNSSGSDTSSD